MSIILRPVITEKATRDSEMRSRYAFYVSPQANKHQIKDAVKELYGVEVISVRTLVSAPKVKSRYTKRGFQTGKTNKLKKAIVQLEEGQEIDLYGNI